MILQQTAAKVPDSRALTLLVDGETQEQSLTFAELDRKAKQAAVALQRLGLQGERVLLVFPFGQDNIAALMGCLYAGAVAVFTYPPGPGRPLADLENTAVDSGAKAALTTQSFLSLFQAHLPEYPVLRSLNWIVMDAVFGAEDPAVYLDPGPSGEAPALLSYTSGSTSSPRGVLLSNQNLVAAVGSICDLFPLDSHWTHLFGSPLNHVSPCMEVIAAWPRGCTRFFSRRSSHSSAASALAAGHLALPGAGIRGV
jgi:acyl-CoA synthetase (AMP-forming)/AMP-acid ligase II